MRYSNILALFAFTLSIVSVLALAFVCILNFETLSPRSSYSVILEGTRLRKGKKSKWLLLYPAFFFVRRAAFAYSVVFLGSNLVT